MYTECREKNIKSQRKSLAMLSFSQHLFTLENQNPHVSHTNIDSHHPDHRFKFLTKFKPKNVAKTGKIVQYLGYGAQI